LTTASWRDKEGGGLKGWAEGRERERREEGGVYKREGRRIEVGEEGQRGGDRTREGVGVGRGRLGRWSDIFWGDFVLRGRNRSLQLLRPPSHNRPVRSPSHLGPPQSRHLTSTRRLAAVHARRGGGAIMQKVTNSPRREKGEE